MFISCRWASFTTQSLYFFFAWIQHLFPIKSNCSYYFPKTSQQLRNRHNSIISNGKRFIKKKKKTSLKNSIEKFFIHTLTLQTYSMHSSLIYESKFLLISRYQTTTACTVFCVCVDDVSKVTQSVFRILQYVGLMV